MSERKKRPTAEVINPGLGDIEKVRDILFGKYVSSFEHRFAELEERLEADVDKLMKRLSDKIANMDKAVNLSLERLNKEIADEKAERDSEVNALQNTLKDAETALQHSLSAIEDQANQDLKAVRASLDDSHKDMLDKALSLQTELTQQIENQKEELQGDKVGRQALALMLDEVAVKLRAS